MRSGGVKKIIICAAVMVWSISGAAHAYGIHGKPEFMCDAKDGTEYVLNSISFPQTIEVNSNYLSLNKVAKAEGGYRHYHYYEDYTKQEAEVAVKGANVLLSVGNEMMPCK